MGTFFSFPGKSENMKMSVQSFDIRNPQECVLFVKIMKEDDLQAFLAMHFSIEWEFLGAVDLYPSLLENGFISDKPFYPDIYVD